MDSLLAESTKAFVDAIVSRGNLPESLCDQFGLLDELKSLEDQNSDLTSEIGSLKVALEAKDNEIKKLKADARKASATSVNAQNDLNSQIKALQDELSKARRDLSTARAELNSIKTKPHIAELEQFYQDAQVIITSGAKNGKDPVFSSTSPKRIEVLVSTMPKGSNKVDVSGISFTRINKSSFKDGRFIHRSYLKERMM